MRRDSKSSGGRRRRSLALLGVAATATALVLLTPAPAVADDDTDLAVEVEGGLALERPNDSDDLVVRVRNNGPESAGAELRVRVPLDGVRFVGATASCNGNGGEVECRLRRVRANRTAAVRMRFQAPDRIYEPRRETGTVEIGVNDGDDINGGNNNAQFDAVLGAGENGQPNVGDGPIEGVSGRVLDKAKNKPVNKAKVVLTDTAGGRRQVLSKESGEFSWDADEGDTLAAGVITITVTADGYRETKTSVLVSAGQKAENVQITLAGGPPPSPSAKPSAQPVQADTAKKKGSDDESGGLDPLGVLLIGGMIAGTLGAVAIVIWMWRTSKRRDGDPDGDDALDDPEPLLAPAAAGHATAPPPETAAMWNAARPTEDLSAPASQLGVPASGPQPTMAMAAPAPSEPSVAATAMSPAAGLPPAPPTAPVAPPAPPTAPSAPPTAPGAPPVWQPNALATPVAPSAPATAAGPPAPLPPPAPTAPAAPTAPPTALSPSVAPPPPAPPTAAPAPPSVTPSVTPSGAPGAPVAGAAASSVQPSWPDAAPRHRFSDGVDQTAAGTGAEPRHARSDRDDDLWRPKVDPGGAEEWPDEPDPETIRSSDTQGWQPTFDAEPSQHAGADR